MGLLYYVLPIGFLAQYIDGTLGMGYGVSSSSLLLAMGFMPAAVSASVHAAQVFTCLASGLSHLKLNNVDLEIVLPLSCAGVIGGVAGAYFLSNISGALLKPYIGLLLMLLGAKILITFLRRGQEVPIRGRFSRKLLLPLGLAGGMVDAIGGGGWGPICTPALVSANKQQPRYIVGSVNTAEFFTALSITITFLFTLGPEKFLWGITIPLMIGGVFAAPMAAYTCRRISPAILGLAIGTILIILNMRTAAPVLSKTVGVEMSIAPEFVATLAVAGLIASVAVSRLFMRRLSSDSGS